MFDVTTFLFWAKVLGDNREEWENQLEERLRKQLEIVPGRPVLEERRPQPLVPVISKKKNHTRSKKSYHFLLLIGFT